MKKSLLSLAAAACLSMGISAQAALYATGDFNDWDPVNAVAFAEAADGYTITIPELTKLKISSVAGEWDEFNAACLAIADGAKVEAGETMALTVGDADIAMPWKGDWTITVNSELTTLVATTTTPKPEQAHIYIRGGMNGWEAVPEWEMATRDGNVYTLKGVSIGTDVEWKLADADWGVVNYGTSDPVLLGEAYELYSGGGNIKLAETAESLDIYFTLSTATLLVTEHSDMAPLYATGDFEASNWAADAPVMFTIVNGEYVLDITDVSMFKISTETGAGADDAWGVFNGGARQIVGRAELVAGEPMTLEAGDANIVMPWRGDWHIVVSADLTTITGTTTTPKPEGPTDIYLRGGMNSWNAEDAWKFYSEDGETYVLNNVVIPESEEWKVADDNWSKINYGVAEKGEAVVLEEPFELEYNGANIKIDYLGEAVDAVDVLFTLSDHTIVITAAGGINDIISNTAERRYFNIQGIEVAHPTTGLYIIKQGNKTTKAYIIAR